MGRGVECTDCPLRLKLHAARLIRVCHEIRLDRRRLCRRRRGRCLSRPGERRQNHLDGVGGPDHVTIALVIHGQALRAFHSSSANPDLSKRVEQFSRAGLELAACGNTMKSQNVALKDLLPGFVVAERGGVVRIAELQSQGYLCLRP